MARKVLIPFILFLALLGFSLISILHFFHIQELPKESIGVVLDDVISDTIPSKDGDYWFSSATCTNQGSASWNGMNWTLKLNNITKTRTKCNLQFSKTMNIHLHSTLGLFTDNATEKTVTISKSNVSTELENIIKPTYGSAKYLFLSYNSKEDGTGVTLSYESLLQGITDYYAVWKKNFATVSFRSSNLLPIYTLENDQIPEGAQVTQINQREYLTTDLYFITDETFETNAFALLLVDLNNYKILNSLFNYPEGERTQTFTFTLDSGTYTLETRLNGSKKDIKLYHDYYFTKGKTYSVHANISSSENRTKWSITSLSLQEVIDPIEVILGNTVTRPNTTIYKPGYTIGELWYTDYERTKLFDFNTPITEDITLYPGFRTN